MNSPIHHGTVVVEWHLPANRARIFQALSDRAEREAWGAPGPTAAYRIETADFRPGGIERVWCGSADNPDILVTTLYHRIEADRTIVYSECIAQGGAVLAANLSTAELLGDGERTLVRTTVQVASFVGPEMIANTDQGTRGSMRHLEQFLSAEASR